MNILGIKIDEVSRLGAIKTVAEFLSLPGLHTVFTPNPEMIVKAQKDEYFKNVLNTSDLSLCDGFGLWLAARVQGFRFKVKIERVTGVDFMLELCRLAEERGKSVFLLGSGSQEVAKKTADKLLELFPKLKIAGYDKGPKINENVQCSTFNVQSNNNGARVQWNSESRLIISPEVNDELAKGINAAKPDILFVAFGMGKQEKWIYENLTNFPSIKIAMGVGGAFDYMCGNIRRAPRLMRKIGIEWLYRLVCQPSRLPRIFNAVAQFSYLFLTNGKS